MIRVSLEDSILRLALSRPEKRNALTNAMYGSLADALERAESDPDIRAVLFEAEGDVFCAGNDLSDFQAIASGALKPSQMHARRFLEALARATRPLVAAVHGPAVGIGTTLLLHCDAVYLADSAVLSTPFVNLALVPEAASSLLLPARIGHVRAFAMFALGEALSAQDALSLGLANAVVSSDNVHARALEAAQALARQPPEALRATKQLMRDAELVAGVMRKELEVFVARLGSAEAAERFRSLRQRS